MKYLFSSALQKYKHFATGYTTVCGVALCHWLTTGGALSAPSYNQLETFDDPVPTAETQMPDTWYPDRYPPQAFESYDLNGESVLRLAIDPADGAQNRPSNFSSVFYNTQGRKFDLEPGVTGVSAKLYFPESWTGLDTRRRSDIWTTAVDDMDMISYYAILGIANVDGTPVIRCYDGLTGEWIDSSITPTPNTWYRLDILIEDSSVVYLVNGIEIGRTGSNESIRFKETIFQAYNFNDSNLDAELQSSEAYDAYWDDYSTDFTLEFQPDVTIGKDYNPFTHTGREIFSPIPKLQSIKSKANFGGKSGIYVGVFNAGDRGDLTTLSASGAFGRKVDLEYEDPATGANLTAALKAGTFSKFLNPGEGTLIKSTMTLSKKAERRLKRKARINRKIKTIEQTQRFAGISGGSPVKVDSAAAFTYFGK